jgi:predicted RNase H-like HicB family nuclease
VPEKEYIITAFWDSEADVWVAESEDIKGLVTEAATLEQLREKLRILIPELLELNESKSSSRKISYCLKTDYHETITA